MKVLMVSSLPLAAPWNGADKNLARVLVEADPSTEFHVLTGRTDVWPDHVVTYRTSVKTRPALDSWMQAAWHLVMRTASVDLIHVVASFHHPSPAMAQIVRTWSTVTGRPVLHTAPSLGDQPLPRTVLFGDVTVALSSYTEQRLARADVPGVTRIFPALDVARLRPTIDPGTLRARLDLGPRPVLYAAHLGETNGVMDMLRAFADLPADLSDATLVLAARAHRWQREKDAKRDIEDAARSLGVVGRLRILDDVTDMPSLISACALTALVPEALGSKADLPLVLLESLALGRPILIADRAPLNEALLDGGLAVPPGDHRALVAALTRLLGDVALRSRLGERGRANVCQLTDPHRVAAEYHRVYEELLKDAPLPGVVS